MTADGADPDDATVPVDAVPQPTLCYALRDGDPVVTDANRAFASTFDAPASGTPLREWLDDRRVSLAADAEGVCDALAAGDAVDATMRLATGAGDGTYRLRAVPGTPDAGDGVLTVAAAAPSRDGAPGVDRIASVVSHDLRNPLDVATAHLRAARERGDAEHFDRVAAAHDRMERIVQDVLTLARGEAAIAASATVDLATVAGDAWTTVDTGAATLDCEDDLPTVAADPDRLQRLFENLFRNSVEHGSTADGDAPHVRVGPTGDGGFFVADDGRGVPPDERDLVFEPGYSTDDTGAGLGLTIVERIAAGHGWRVTVTAGPDGGARFEFRERDDE